MAVGFLCGDFSSCIGWGWQLGPWLLVVLCLCGTCNGGQWVSCAINDTGWWCELSGLFSWDGDFGIARWQRLWVWMKWQRHLCVVYGACMVCAHILQQVRWWWLTTLLTFPLLSLSIPSPSLHCNASGCVWLSLNCCMRSTLGGWWTGGLGPCVATVAHKNHFQHSVIFMKWRNWMF